MGEIGQGRGAGAAFAGASSDKLILERPQAAERGQNQTAVRGGGASPGVARDLRTTSRSPIAAAKSRP